MNKIKILSLLLRRAGVWIHPSRSSAVATGSLRKITLGSLQKVQPVTASGVCGQRSPLPTFFPSECVCMCVCVCFHRVSVLRGSRVNTEWSHTGNKLSDETLKNY